MGPLFANIALGFDIYLSFFVVFVFSIIAIIGSAAPVGLILGFFYKLYYKR